MSAKKSWTREEADRVLDHVADSIETEDAAEIATDLHDAGHDVNDVASRMKAAALAGVKGYRQQRLHHARRCYQESSLRIGRRTRCFGASHEERRRRFFLVIGARPELKSALTMQHRDLDDLTDADVDSALEDLEILGVFEDLDDSHS